MTLVTFLSDFGNEDHYVAAVKAAILSESSLVNIVDISHNINPFDIGHAAYVLSHAYKNFPEGTVHLIAVDPSDKNNHKALAVKMDNHFFVGCDSGIFSLISSKTQKKLLNYRKVNQPSLPRIRSLLSAPKLPKGLISINWALLSRK